MTRKDVEEIPLLRPKDKQGTSHYGSVESPSSKSNAKFTELFCYATLKDKVYLTVATIVGVLGTLTFPLSMIVLFLPMNAAINVEQLERVMLSPNTTWSVDNETARMDAANQLIDVTVFCAYVGLVVFVVQLFIYLSYIYVFGLVAVRITKRMREKYLWHVVSQDMSWSQSKTAGELTAMLDENISKMSDALETNLPLAIQQAGDLTFSLAVCFLISWDVTLVMVCFLLPAGLLFYIGTKHYIKYVSIEQGFLAKAAETASECFLCIKTVICFNGQKQTIERFEQQVDQAMDASRRRCDRSAWIDATKLLCIDSLTIAAMCYGARVLDIDAGLLIAVVSMGVKMSSLVPVFNMHLNAILVAVGSAHQLIEVMKSRPEIEVDGGETPANIRPTISFKNVFFSYPSRPDVTVLHDFSLDINPGEKIGIVGESGCGKSTLIALLMRFFDPDSGSITLDGRPLTSLNISWLRSCFGLISQEPVLFNMSVRENVSNGNPSATYDQMIDALNQANATHFVLDMPQGINTVVGERGTQLSGGQKQRVAIARALVRDPAVLLCDEATSSLDTASEAEVQQAIDKVSRGRTTITVAHRLSTILNAHRIVVVENGTIIEQGPPKELISQRNIFYRLLRQQNIIKGGESIFAQSDSSDNEALEDRVKALQRPSRRHRSTQSISSASDFEPNVPVVSHQFPPSLSDDENLTDPEPEENTKISQIGHSSSAVVRSVLAMEPEAKRLVPVVLVCSCLRALRTVSLLIVMSLLFDALSYSYEQMIERINIVTYAFIGIMIVGYIGEVGTYISVPMYSDKLTSKVRVNVLTHFLSQNLAYFNDPAHNSGTLSASLATHPANIRETASGRIPELITSIFISFFGICVVFYMNPLLALACLGLKALLAILRMFETAGLMKEQKKLQPKEAQANSTASETFTNLSTVKAYNLESHFCQRYKDQYAMVGKQKMRRVFVNGFLIGSSYALNLIGGAVAWLVFAYLMRNLQAELIDFLMCVNMFATITFGRVLNVLTQSRLIARAIASCHAVVRTLDEHIPINTLSSAGTHLEVRGDAFLNRVKFSYPSRAEIQVFDALNLHLECGRTVAVVGPSGSGKSTILHLILRLYDCDRGRVSIDHQNVTTINVNHLHENVVPVTQEPTLFNQSIFENITYGLSHQQLTSARVISAARRANIHDFVISLPDGYNTHVGELGAKLSGGQKQRLAIARALIREPKILLLDEATAALDSTSEALVQETLDRAKRSRTCVMVAHRLSTVRNADLIVVLADGKVAETGTHLQLLDQGGLYYNMCRRQEAFEN